MAKRSFGQYTQRPWAEDVKRFLEANKDFRIVSDHGIRVKFTRKIDYVRNWAGIQLNVCIDDDTRQGDIQKSWKFVEEWRRRLQAWQGKEGDAFIDYLLQLREQGHSYAEIADSINGEIAQVISETISSMVSNELDPFLKAEMDAVFFLLGRLGEEGSTAFFEEISRNIINGRPVFDGLNEPATEENIRGIIRGQITRRGW